MKTSKDTFAHQDPEVFFRTDEVTADLKGRSLRGGAVTLTAQVLNFLLQTLGFLLLARFLTPADFGLIGMVTIVVQFMLLIKDLGLAKAVIQREHITHRQVSALFWINLFISTTLTLLVIMVAPMIAWFYDEPRLTWIVLALSVSVILGGLPAQHQALLRRQMRFTSLAMLEITALILGLGTALVFAVQGAGYWSLVLWRLVPVFTIAIGIWFICGWRPGWYLWGSGVGSMLTFGGNIAGYRGFAFVSRNLDNILIGRVWGAQELGLYALAYRLLLLPIQQINAPLISVALPALSRLQADPQQYRRYYNKAVLVITTLGMPLVGLTCVIAGRTILVLLGEQWLESVYLFWCLAPAAWVGTFNMAMLWAFASLDRTDRQLKWGIVSSTVTAIIFFIGVHWGALGIAIGYGLSQPLIIGAGFIYCYQGTSLKIMDLARTISRPTIAMILATAITMSIDKLLLNDVNILLGLIFTSILYFLFYFGIWIILPNGQLTMQDILATARSLR